MAAKGNSNRGQKNTVRVALATAATVTTLLGAQVLAFAGSLNAESQAQNQETTVTSEVQAQPTIVVTPTAVQSTSATKVSVAPTQPTPRTRSSR
jgi:hypothetical protein